MLSTYFPNRTAEWGTCCSDDETKTLLEILNHKKLLVLLTNQHHNMTHPKLLSIPRGLPLNSESTMGLAKKIIWDTMRKLVVQRKEKFVFSATSSAFHRLQIIGCISKKVIMIFNLKSFRVIYRCMYILCSSPQMSWKLISSVSSNKGG